MKALPAIWMIAERELRDQLRDWRIVLPLIILTIFFPFLMIRGTEIAIATVQEYGANLIADRLSPFFLMVVGFFPMTVSLVVALEAFVGEKERGTIEPLLSSPLADWHIYVGKLLAGSIVPLIASFVSMGIYTLMLVLRDIQLPGAVITLQMILLNILHGLLMVTAAMLISTQSTSVRSANLLASFIVIPVALLLQAEVVMIFWGNEDVLWLAILGLMIISSLLLRMGLAHFQREALIGRELDSLNLAWAWQYFKRQFKGEARSVIEWYTKEIPRTLRALSTANLVITVLLLVGILISYSYVENNARQFIAMLPVENVEEVIDRVQTELNIDHLASLNSPALAGYIFANNVRAVFVITFFGIFTLGVLGIMGYLLNVVLIGGVLALIELAGLSPMLLFIYGILPHGIFELPALMLSSAAVLYIGAIMVTPNTRISIGEVFLNALAVWAKITVGVTIPFLAIAALIESFVTPQLLLSIM